MKLKPIWTMNFRLALPSTKVFEFDMGLGEPEPDVAAEPNVLEPEAERTPAGFSPNPLPEMEEVEELAPSTQSPYPA